MITLLDSKKGLGQGCGGKDPPILGAQRGAILFRGRPPKGAIHLTPVILKRNGKFLLLQG